MDDPAPFRDPDRPLSERVADLLGRLTPGERLGLLHQHQAPVPRLGIGSFRTGTEALHGVAWLGPATVFPQAVGLGATWDPELVRRVGAAVGDEVRALHHKDPDRTGLNVWAPVVNPLRDPRWGRNEEGYAEDPWLTGLLGTAYAAGLRGDDARYLRTAPTLKHFLGYNNETDRATTSSDLPPRVLHEYDLPPFRAPIAAGAAVAVMASYNLVNGRPAHLSPHLSGALRSWTGDELLVVGDAGAGTNIATLQGWLPDHPTAFGAALRAGIDSFTEDGDDPAPTLARLTEALDRGLIEASDVDRAAARALAVRFRLGEFDPAEDNPYAAITADVVNCAEHQVLAREAARAGTVLLQNSGVLPLRADRTVAVIGPLAGTVLTDWYSGTLPYAVTPHAGLAARLGADRVGFADGCDRVVLRTAAGEVGLGEESLRVGAQAAEFDVLDWGGGLLTLRSAATGRYVRADDDGTLTADRAGPGEWVVRETFATVPRDGGVVLRHVASGRHVTTAWDGTLRAAAEAGDATVFTVDLLVDGPAAAAEVARRADVAVVVLGNHPMVDGRETEDRAGLDLPVGQEALLRAVHAANPACVLVLSSSYPYAVRWAREHLPAVLWTAHGGQEAGAALADVLLGATADGQPAEPLGRLPQTWYADAADLPDLLDYDIAGAEATYLWFRGEPLYPFGHGLGYTRFRHENLSVREADGRVEVRVDVVNKGDRPGTEVVQVYTRPRNSRRRQPVRTLRGFRRVRLDPGERATLALPFDVAELAYFDVARGRMVVEDGDYTVSVGTSCTAITATARLSVRGEVVGDRDAHGGPLRASDRDEQYGTRLVAESVVDGDAAEARVGGAWLEFDAVDFGAGAGAVTLRVTAPAGGGLVEVRLDDPFSGPPAAVAVAPAVLSAYAWVEVTVPLAGATGVHDLYLVLDRPGLRVATATFRAGVP